MNSFVLPLLPVYVHYLSQSLKVGTAITAFIGILKAFSELTVSGRRNRALEKAIRLAGFLDALGKVASVADELGADSELFQNAKREFIQAASRCSSPKLAPSKFRLALLIYLPPRLIAYIPHFLFFTLCALIVSAAVGISGDILDKTADVSDLTIILFIGILVYFMQQWAAVEWRRSQQIHLFPRTLWRGLRWYPASSFWALFANFMVVIYPIFMVFSFAVVSSNNQIGYSVWPAWQLVVTSLVACHLIIVTYFWPRAEYLLSSGQTKLLSIRRVILRARGSQTLESAIGLLVFFLLTIWCFILLLNMRYVHRIASFADGSAGTAGEAAAWAIILTMLFLYGIIPWIAVYRGLSELLDYGSRTTEEVRHG